MAVEPSDSAAPFAKRQWRPGGRPAAAVGPSLAIAPGRGVCKVRAMIKDLFYTGSRLDRVDARRDDAAWVAGRPSLLPI